VQYAFVRAGQSRLSDARTLDVVTSGSLPAPTVDEAVAQVLDPLDLINGFTVRTPANADLLPSDTVTASLTGGSGTTPYTSAARPGAKGMIFTLPAASLATHLGKIITVYYTRTRSGSPTASDTSMLGVDGVTNGDSRLPAPVIVQAVAGVLDLASFIGDATVTVRPWPLIAAGQPIGATYVVNGKTTVIRVGPVTQEEVLAGLRIPMPRAGLDALPDASSLTVTLDVVFNTSAPVAFPSTTAQLRKGATDWVAPSVDNATGGRLEPANALAGAVIRVPANPDFRPTDTVIVTWSGGPGSGSWSSPPQAGNTAGLSVTTPPAAIAYNMGKAVSVTYAVTRAGSTSTSAAFSLTVGTYTASQLPQPSIDKASGGELDMGGFTGDPCVIVAPWPFMAVGQPVSVVYTAGGKTIVRDKVGVTAAELAAGLSVPIPRAPLDALNDGTSMTLNVITHFDGVTETYFRDVIVTLRTAKDIVEDFESFAQGTEVKRGTAMKIGTITDLNTAYEFGIGSGSLNGKSLNFSRPQNGGYFPPGGYYLQVSLNTPSSRVAFNYNGAAIGGGMGVSAMHQGGTSGGSNTLQGRGNYVYVSPSGSKIVSLRFQCGYGALSVDDITISG
jgi:hypothetical protein